jgi:hypothetical protein
MPTSMPTSLPSISPQSWEQFQQQSRDFFQAQWQTTPRTLPELLESLTTLHAGYGVLLAVAGVMYLFIGWRLFKPLVMLNAAAVGAILGGLATVQLGMPQYGWIGMLVGGGMMGILAWPLMKLFVSLFGGAFGAAVGFSVFQQVVLTAGRSDLLPYAWAGAVLGALAVAALALTIFRLGVMVATAWQGAAMLAGGVLCLLLKFAGLGQTIRQGLLTNPPTLLLIVLGVGLAGLVVQVGTSHRHGKKQNASSSSADEARLRFIAS